jgi:hypothetical protein
LGRFKRGVFPSVTELQVATDRFVAATNADHMDRSGLYQTGGKTQCLGRPLDAGVARRRAQMRSKDDVLVAGVSHGITATYCKLLKQLGNGCNNVQHGSALPDYHIVLIFQTDFRKGGPSSSSSIGFASSAATMSARAPSARWSTTTAAPARRWRRCPILPAAAARAAPRASIPAKTPSASSRRRKRSASLSSRSERWNIRAGCR